MEKWKAFLRLALLPVVSVLSVWFAPAQTTQGLIAGRLVNSQTGAPIANAQIAYSNAATGASGVAVSDPSGNYFLPLLSPGIYRVRATADAFQSREVQELELPVAARLELEFRLRPLSDVWESGEYRSVFLPGTKTIVTFYGPDVDSSRSGSFEAAQGKRGALESTVSQVIDPAEIRDLPLAGRDVYTMLVTQPGVTSDAATGRGLGLSVNGQRPSSSNFMLDGLENNNYLITGPLTPVAPEAIEEYRVSTNNFSAEYGRTSGYLANAITRSGGNRFHGIGYFYLKNDVLNANGFQANLAGLERVPDKEDQFGFQVGGPILKDRLFFSGSFDHLRSRSFQDPQQFDLPSTALISLLADAPSTRLSRQLLQKYPSSYVPKSTSLTALVTIAPPVSVDESTGLERIDYNSRDGVNRLMGRVAISRLGRPNFIWSPYKDFISALDENTLGVALGYIRTLRPGLVNEVKLSRTSDDLGWNRPHPEVSTLNATDIVQTSPGFFAATNLLLPGSPAFYAYSNNSRTWEMLDNITWARGRHVATAGGGVLLRSSSGYLTAGRDGQYIFSGVFGFILDQPAQLRATVNRQNLPDLQQPDFNRKYRYNQYFLFAQDTFRLTPRLTLNYGIRYESYGAPSNVGPVKDAEVQLGSGSSFPQRIAGAQLIYPTSGNEQLYKPDRNDWAPRVGFSYDLTGTGKTIVRGAYGIFYDRPFDNLWQNVRTNNFTLPSFNLTGTVNYLAPISQELQLIAPTLKGKTLDTSFPNLTVFDQDLRDAYVQSYFFGVQRQISQKWTAEVNTLGSLGRKFITTDIVNRAFSVGTDRFNDNLGDLAWRSGQGISDYNALTAVARYRSGGKQFQIAYTWSHTIDNQSEPLTGDFFNLQFTQIGPNTTGAGYAAFARQFDSNGDHGNSDFDQRQNLFFLSIWELRPLFTGSRAGLLFRDWKFSQLAAFRSGFPYTVFEPAIFDPAHPVILYNARADVINPGAAVLANPTPVTGGELLLNSAAFAQSANGSNGNTGRNAFRGPGLYNIDISLSRSIPLHRLGEGGRFTFRADVFNFLNHANLNNPASLIGQPNFGQASFGRQGAQSGFPAVAPLNETARQVQLILRLEF